MQLRGVVAGAVVLCLLGGCTASKKKWGNGATTGALIGAGLGGLGGPAVQYWGRDKDGTTQLGNGAAVGAGAGIILGGLIGHLLWDEEAPTATPTPEPTPEPTPQPVSAGKIVLHKIHFDFKSAALRPDAKPLLDEAVRLLAANPHTAVWVDGHTDSIGSTDYNLFLGERRAEAVRNYLVQGGIDAGRLKVRSFGKSQPVASNATEEGRAQNRRVELKFGKAE